MKRTVVTITTLILVSCAMATILIPAANQPKAPTPRPPTPTLTNCVDINEAGQDMLTHLPGIGPELASRIIAHRETAAFESVDDLEQIGIGANTIDRLRPLVCEIDQAEE